MAWGLRDAAFCATDAWGAGAARPWGAPKCSARDARRWRLALGGRTRFSDRRGCRRRGTEEGGGRVGAVWRWTAGQARQPRLPQQRDTRHEADDEPEAAPRAKPRGHRRRRTPRRAAVGRGVGASARAVASLRATGQ